MKLCGFCENPVDAGAAADFCDYHCRRAAEVNDTFERNMDWFGVALRQFVIRETWTADELRRRSCWADCSDLLDSPPGVLSCCGPQHKHARLSGRDDT